MPATVDSKRSLGNVWLIAGTGGTPNGVITAPRGSTFYDDSTGVVYYNTTSSGSGTTWVVAAAVAAAGGGTAVAQVVATNFTAVATGTTLAPVEDVAPTIARGTQFMSQAITPNNAASMLDVYIVATGSMNVAHTFTMSLHRDGATAIAATAGYSAANTALVTTTLMHSVLAGSTTATTFTVRIGPTSANTYTFNGQLGTRVYGAITKSYIRITERLP